MNSQSVAPNEKSSNSECKQLPIKKEEYYFFYRLNGDRSGLSHPNNYWIAADRSAFWSREEGVNHVLTKLWIPVASFKKMINGWGTNVSEERVKKIVDLNDSYYFQVHYIKVLFLMGTHPKPGANSSIYTLFGTKPGLSTDSKVLNNPLADKQVFKQIFDFL